MAFKMRICVITPYYHPIKGGITSYVSNLVKALQESKNMAIDVITRSGEKCGGGVSAIKTNKIFFIAKTYMQLHKRKYDVIHSHAHWYTLVPSILYKIFNPKTRIIHTFHTDPLNEMKGLKKKLLEWLLSKCNTVTFVSFFLMEKIGKNLKISTNKKVIYAGAPENNLNENEIKKFKEKYKLENNAPILSFVGGLAWKMKVEGVKRLIEAFKYIIKEYPNAKLLIIGDGVYKKDLELLVEDFGIKKNIIFTGFLDNVFIPLAATDIYTHISLQEGGFPISILEAMSIGKPVIATKVGGMPEIIVNNENGILVYPDPKLIAKAIIELYKNNKKMEELGKNAYKTVKENYTWDKISSDFMKIYNNI